MEAKTCIIPTSGEEKRWIKVFELLKHVVENLLVQIEQLGDESLGYVKLSSEELLIKNYFL